MLLWKSWRYSSSCRRFAGIVLPLEALYVFFFVQRSCRYSSSCERAAAILLRVKDLQVFFFLWKVSRYPSCSCGRGKRSAGKSVEYLQLFFFLRNSWRVGFLLSVLEMHVLFFLWNSSRYTSSCRKAGCIFLHIRELQVFFFLWKSCSYSSSCGRAAGILFPIGELQVIYFL